jgi:lysozyme family protein
VTPASVQYAIDRILEAEGGVADVGDGKGLTRFGQTPQWLDDNGFIPPSNAADAAINYETWMQRTGLVDICIADRIVGYLVTDCAAHSGLYRAIVILQKALGVRADGVMGPRSQAAFRAVAGQPSLARSVYAERLRFVGELLWSEKADRRRWARGWLNRLADQVMDLP